jgi:hypothetical protein
MYVGGLRRVRKEKERGNERWRKKVRHAAMKETTAA